MPVFEYYCPDNHTVYQFFARSSGMDKLIPRCPDNPSFKMKKKVSDFSVTGGSDIEQMDRADEGSNDPKIQQALQELETNVTSLDRNNPNEINQLMEKMSQITGEKLPKELQEIVKRIQSGENSESLEAQYKEYLEQNPEEETSSSNTSSNKKAKAFRIKKDPKLYELSDYATHKTVDAEPDRLKS